MIIFKEALIFAAVSTHVKIFAILCTLPQMKDLFLQLNVPVPDNGIPQSCEDDDETLK